MESKHGKCARGVVYAAGAGMCLLGLTASAQAWIEQGDAGDGIGGNYQLIDDSQGPTLTEIMGSTDGNQDDYVDSYLLTINNPTTFFASTEGGAGFDTIGCGTRSRSCGSKGSGARQPASGASSAASWPARATATRSSMDVNLRRGRPSTTCSSGSRAEHTGSANGQRV